MTEKYTAEQVLDTLAKVVAGKEDFVYRLDQRNEYGNVQCNYAEDDGSPSCIVGHVAAALDPDLFCAFAEGGAGWWILRRHERLPLLPLSLRAPSPGGAPGGPERPG